MVAAGTWIVLAKGTPPRKANPHATEPAPAPGSGSDTEIWQLQGSLAQVNRRLAELESQIPPGGSGSAVAPAAPEAVRGDTGRAPDELTPEAIKEGRKRAMERLEVVDRSFQGEARDSTWAPQMESHVEDVLARGKYGETNVLSSSCRTSLCRIEAVHGDRESRDAFENMHKELEGNLYIQNIEPDDVNGDGRLRTVVFVVREGHERENALYDLMYATR
jgi:hypothetical protein